MPMPFPLPANELDRLAALRRHAILDTPPEPAYDRITRLASTIFRVPIVRMVLLDADRQWIKSCVGPALDDPRRELSFCTHSILSEGVTIIQDTWKDPFFRDHPFVCGPPHVRFYASAPICSADGFALGTLCLVDMQPRAFGAHDAAVLRDLADVLGDALTLHLNTLASAEEAGASRRRAAALIDSSDDAIVSKDLGGNILSWNAGAERLYGYSAHEMVGQPMLRLIPPDRLAEEEDIIARVRRGERVESFDTLRQTKGGELIDVSVTVSPIRDQAGRVVGASNIARDATERKTAQAALRRSEENYRQLFDTNPLPSWAYDLNTLAFLEVNQAMVRHYGYSREELLAMNLADLFLPEDVPALREAIANLHGGPSPARLWRNRKKDGAIIEIEGAAASITFEGRPARLVIVHDVTERNRIEEHRRAKEEAERASEAKSEFLSRMSHELRTPLNAILGFSQLLELEQLTNNQQDSLQHILNGGRHLLKLIDEVLDIARVESGRMEMLPEAVDIDAVAREALSLIAPLAAAREVTLVLPAPPSPRLRVNADRQRLKQVLLNLLSNAVKYNARGGSVALEYGAPPTAGAREAEAGEPLRLRVADTGPGIAPEKRERLFIPFDRLDAEQTGVEGTGLGLALSRCLMEAMGGKLSLETNPTPLAGLDGWRLGAVFRLELPLLAGEDPAQPAPDQSDANQGLLGAAGLAPLPEGRTLLYVEDNLANLALIERLLQAYPDVRLLTAMQGTLGLDLAAQYRPDLILLDVHLPDLPGWEVLARLKAEERTRDIPVIVISADATQRQIERMRGAGAMAYLTKPFNVKQFLGVVGEGLQAAEDAAPVAGVSAGAV